MTKSGNAAGGTPRGAAGTLEEPRGTGVILEPGEHISVEVVNSIAQVNVAEWDGMAGDNVLASYGLLHVLESTRVTAHRSRYFLARGRNGLVGVIASHVDESAYPNGSIPAGGHRVDRMIAGKFATAARYSGVVSLPCLMCGTPIGTDEPISIREGASAEEQKIIATALVEAVEQTARREHWTVCFRQMRRSESALRTVLTERGYLRGAELPTAYLEIGADWTSLLDYRRFVKLTHPSTAKNIPGEINLGKKVGLVIEQLAKPGEKAGILHRLMNEHNLRHNSTPFAFQPTFFEHLETLLGDRAPVYVARIGEQIIGVQVTFRQRNELLAWMVGIDPESGRTAATYFNLGYNRLIERAIADGCRRIYFGPLMWEVKARRGCTSLDMDFFFRTRNPLQKMLLGPLFQVRSKRNDSLSAQLRHKAKKGNEGASGKDEGDDN